MILKKITIFLFAFLVGLSVFAQKGIAHFKITQVNGKEYTYNELKKNTETVLVYFSPTCDHCIHFTEELLKHEKDLKNKQVIMVTYQPMPDVKTFDSTYKISTKPNFKIGTEGYSFIVQKFYKIQRFPYIVLYDKQMQLVKTLNPLDKPDELAKDVAEFN